jgi:hypothetical protein
MKSLMVIVMTRNTLWCELKLNCHQRTEDCSLYSFTVRSPCSFTVRNVNIAPFPAILRIRACRGLIPAEGLRSEPFEKREGVKDLGQESVVRAGLEGREVLAEERCVA